MRSLSRRVALSYRSSEHRAMKTSGRLNDTIWSVFCPVVQWSKGRDVQGRTVTELSFITVHGRAPTEKIGLAMRHMSKRTEVCDND